MTLKDILTLIIAIWGAGLSTYLVIREWNEERRRININLEHVYPLERLRLNITNIGHRPITITGIDLSLIEKRNDQGETIPAGVYFAHDDYFKPPNFPITLTDGQVTYLYLSDYFMDGIYHEGKKIKVKLYDAEGRIYSKYKSFDLNTRWGYGVSARKN